MKMLRNSTKELFHHQKYLLYRTCILFIVLYSSLLQFFNKAPFSYFFKKLRKIQQRVALWITGIFCTSPILGIKAIIGLISIYLHLQKLSGRYQIQTSALLSNHIIDTLLERRYTNNSSLHCLSLENMTDKQRLKIKSSIVDVNNYLNRISSSFNSLNSEFSPGFRLINNFSSCFYFH